MKLMIASDIHGSAFWCRRLLEALERETPERLILLGDLLYHGPRNDLPDDYAPRQVIQMLNALRPRPLCVRGNCEAEVDQMVLHFPVLSDYAVLIQEGHMFFMTHGHIYGEDNPPPLSPGDFLLCGHTHVPACRVREWITYINPGSVSIPKNGTPHSYCTLEGGLMQWKDLERDGAVYDEQQLWT